MSTRISIIAGASLAVAAALVAADARAQTFYVGGEGGWTDLENQRDRNLPPGATARSRFDDGFNVGGKAGYELGPWRFEEEYEYRENDLRSFNRLGGNVPGARGDRESHAIMTNLLYDFNLGWPVTPHIGGGLGAVDVIDHVHSPGLGRIARSDDWELGYQAIGGVRYNVSPQIAVDLDYRYLATTDASFRQAAGGARYRSGYDTHNVVLSAVYRFAPPPPPPPIAVPMAAPAPPPPSTARVFLVFFDWDRDTITPEGMQIVQQAADAYKAGGSVRLQVTGYTDRSGSPGYNQRLSERRANNVANALARLGVARSDMAVSGRGENDNRVPTANGVREPQNRRVEIVFP